MELGFWLFATAVFFNKEIAEYAKAKTENLKLRNEEMKARKKEEGK